MFAVDVIIVHFGEHVSASGLDAAIEARAQREISRCGNNSEVVDAEVLSARTEVGGWIESVGDQDKFPVFVRLSRVGGEYIGEVVWAIRGNDRRDGLGERLLILDAKRIHDGHRPMCVRVFLPDSPLRLVHGALT